MHPALAGKRAPRLSRLSVTVFGLLSAAGIATGGAGICPPGAGDRGPGGTPRARMPSRQGRPGGRGRGHRHPGTRDAEECSWPA